MILSFPRCVTHRVSLIASLMQTILHADGQTGELARILDLQIVYLFCWDDLGGGVRRVSVPDLVLIIWDFGLTYQDD